MLLDGTDKLYLEAAASRSIIESLYPPSIRERLMRRNSKVSNTSMMEEGIFEENENQDDDVGAELTKRSNRSIFRSDSMLMNMPN